MKRLRIRLLGAFQVDLEGVPITQFESNKVRALLAYMAVEHHQAHSREKLAALFWPGMPSRRASSNLSQALYNLRRLIQDQQAQPPFLLRERAAVQIASAGHQWQPLAFLHPQFLDLASSTETAQVPDQDRVGRGLVRERYRRRQSSFPP